MEPSRCNIWQLVSVRERREERQPRLLIIACGTQTPACWALLPGVDVYHRVGDRRAARKMSVIHLCRVDAGARAVGPAAAGKTQDGQSCNFASSDVINGNHQKKKKKKGEAGVCVCLFSTSSDPQEC